MMIEEWLSTVMGNDGKDLSCVATTNSLDLKNYVCTPDSRIIPIISPDKPVDSRTFASINSSTASLKNFTSRGSPVMVSEFPESGDQHSFVSCATGEELSLITTSGEVSSLDDSVARAFASPFLDDRQSAQEVSQSPLKLYLSSSQVSESSERSRRSLEEKYKELELEWESEHQTILPRNLDVCVKKCTEDCASSSLAQKRLQSKIARERLVQEFTKARHGPLSPKGDQQSPSLISRNASMELLVESLGSSPKRNEKLDHARMKLKDAFLNEQEALQQQLLVLGFAVC